MGRYTGKTCRLLCMIGLTAAFFLVEIVVGYVTNSLALVGDSYHMLSDVIALIIGFASVRISKWRSRKNTYGWARAEVLGALINAVFLIALCFTIFIEALQRIVHDDHIHQPELMLIVGGIGLAINIIGLALFGSHGHSHGGHGHSHGGNPDLEEEEDNQQDDSGDDEVLSEPTVMINGEAMLKNDSDDEIRVKHKHKQLKSSAQLNMRAVFLHVMGDALGSVIVIVSALVIKYVEADWKYRIDPAMSMVLVIIILSTTIPLLRESSLILLQTVPTHIQVHDLKEKLMSKVEGVMGIHEFHIWQLAGNRIIASAHIRCQNLRDYMRIAEEVKLFFHNEGIHSTTIQPEFIENSSHGHGLSSNNVGHSGSINKVNNSMICLLDCPCDGITCDRMKCCPIDKNATKKKPSWMKNIRRRKKKHENLVEIIVNPADEKQKLLCGDDKQCCKIVDEKTQTSTKESSIGDATVIENVQESIPVNSPDKRVEDFFHAKKNPHTSQDDSTHKPESDDDGRRDHSHPRSSSDPVDPSPISTSAIPTLQRDNHSMPSINAYKSKYCPNFKLSWSVLNRPHSMHNVPDVVSPSIEPPIRAQSNMALPEDGSGVADVLQQEAMEQTSVSSSVGPAYTSEDALDKNIQRLKQDWRAIRGDTESRESILDH